jgi:hypothetical protein
MTRTLLRILPVAALIALGAPSAVEAQTLNVRRTEHVPSLHTTEQQTTFAAAKETLSALFEAQRAHYDANGRFATSLEELPGLDMHPEIDLRFAAEAEWYVATVGDADIGVTQHVVTLHERDRVAANAVGEAQRAEASGGR